MPPASAPQVDPSSAERHDANHAGVPPFDSVVGHGPPASVERSSTTPDHAVRRLRPTAPDYSPAALLLVYRVMAGLAIWKIVSIDLGPMALADAGLGSQISTHGREPMVRFLDPLYGLVWSEVGLVLLQVGVVISLLAAAVRPWTSTIWASVSSLGLVTLLLSSYRTVYFDLEVPLLAMTVLALFARRPSAEAPHPAGAVWHGTSRPASIALYASLGAAYFFAGVSKLEFAGLRWPQRVRLDLLQPKVMAEVHGARLVAPLRVPADAVHAVLHRQLWLGTAAGWATLLIELTFIAGLLSIRYRRSVATAVVALHVGILFASGINFLPMAALAACLGWCDRWVGHHHNADAVPTGVPSTLPRAGVVAAVLVPLVLVAFPSWTERGLGPYPSYDVFGWTYDSLDSSRVLRLASVRTGESPRLMDPTDGGFYDFSLVVLVSAELAAIEQLPPDQRWSSSERLRSLLAVRSGFPCVGLVGAPSDAEPPCRRGFRLRCGR